MTIDFYTGPYQELVTFSTAVAEAPFASELLSKLEEEYDTIDEAIEDLVEGFNAAGFDATEEDVLEMLTEQIPISAEALEVLAEYYIDEDGEADEVGYERLVNAAVASHQAFIEDDEDEDEYDEDYEDYEDSYEDELYDDLDEEFEVEDEYDEYDEDDLIDEEEAEEFNAAYERVLEFSHQQEISSHLNDLMEYAAHLVEEQRLAPIAFQWMFGQDDGQRAINFSAASESLGIDDVTHLQAIEYALNLFDSIGELTNRAGYRSPLNFSSIAMEDITPDTADEQVDSLAAGIFRGLNS